MVGVISSHITTKSTTIAGAMIALIIVAQLSETGRDGAICTSCR